MNPHTHIHPRNCHQKPGGNVSLMNTGRGYSRVLYDGSYIFVVESRLKPHTSKRRIELLPTGYQGEARVTKVEKRASSISFCVDVSHAE